MCERKTAIIISAGTELTEGIVQDTHVRFLSSELSARGFSVLRGTQVPDDDALFRREISRAAAEARLVVVTGGLGPTADDLTRDVIAGAAGVPLDFHQDAWNAILERFAGRQISDTNRRQAMAPRGFPLIANPNGTAPGFHGTVDGALVVALPGPPGELRPMFSQSVVPLLQARFGGPTAQDYLWGTALMVPESNLEEALRGCRREGVGWGTRVDEDRIAFSLRGGTPADREAVFSGLVSSLGPVRIRRGETRPALLLLDALLARKAALVTAESCTGGLIGKYLTDIPGSSRAYWGGVVAYSNDAKTRLLGVAQRTWEGFGAISEETVSAMARGALERSGADAGIAVSGVAGPDGGSPKSPIGTVWTAVALRAQSGIVDCAARLFAFSGSRDMVRRRAAVAAMLFAESRLIGGDFLDTRTKW